MNKNFGFFLLVFLIFLTNFSKAFGASIVNLQTLNGSINSSEKVGDLGALSRENIIKEFLVTSQNVELFKRSDPVTNSTPKRKPKLYSWWMPNMTMGNPVTESTTETTTEAKPLPTEVLITLKPDIQQPPTTKAPRPSKTCRTLRNLEFSKRSASETTLSTNTPKKKPKLYSWWMPNMAMGGQSTASPATEGATQNTEETSTEPTTTENVITMVSISTSSSKPTKKPKPTKRPPKTRRPTQAKTTTTTSSPIIPDLDDCIDEDQPKEQTTTKTPPPTTIKTIESTQQQITITESILPSTTSFGLKRKIISAVKIAGKVAAKIVGGSIAIGVSKSGPISEVAGKVGSIASDTAVKLAPIAKDAAVQVGSYARNTAGHAFLKLSKKLLFTSSPPTESDQEKDESNNMHSSNGGKKPKPIKPSVNNKAPETETTNDNQHEKENEPDFAISVKADFIFIIIVTLGSHFMYKLFY